MDEIELDRRAGRLADDFQVYGLEFKFCDDPQ